MVAIYAATHSTVWMSAALSASIGASGLFTLLLGALGHRIDRRRVMIASDRRRPALPEYALLTHHSARADRAWRSSA